jgi:hypothetical protein
MKSITARRETHDQIRRAAFDKGVKLYVFVDEVWEFYQRKGAAAPLRPVREEGFEFVRVPENLATAMRDLVKGFSDHPESARDLVTAWKSLRKATLK